MDSISRVKKAIKLEKIDDIPVSFELVGETDLKEFYIGAPNNWQPKRYPPFVFDIEDYIEGKNLKKEDEWGVVWGFGDTLSGGGIPIESPMRSLEDIKDYEFPDPLASGRFDGIHSIIGGYENKYCYATWFGLLFERLHFLLGFNETLMALMTDRREVEYALDRIVDFNIGLINGLADSLGNRIHAFASTDDWGGQKNIFIDPELWRKLFKPRYAKISEEIHKRGLDFWMHSDGKIEEIIPDFIEIGVDVFNLNTSKLLGIKEFGNRFSGKSCFCAYIDTQTTAVHGTLQEIEEDAFGLVKYWSNGHGSGILAMDYRGNEIYQDLYGQEEILERKKIALNAFKKAFKKKLDNNL
jgi:uroporphyrinogen decarboxylase